MAYTWRNDGICDGLRNTLDEFSVHQSLMHWNRDASEAARLHNVTILLVVVMLMRCFMNMSPEYMAELYKFLYLSSDSDRERLLSIVSEHLKFLPRKKLYRYRKCTDRELAMLEKKAVWLSDPRNFPDMFDATVPVESTDYLDFEYAFYCAQELTYKALQNIAEEDGQQIPDKDSFFAAMYQAMEEYGTQEKLDAKMLEMFGEEGYYKMRQKSLFSLDFSKPIERTREFLSLLPQAPRNSLAIASFTTRNDNRNMWENYAQNYTGFCVEYDFSNVIQNLSSKNSRDVLHLLPIRYYCKRPLFDYNSILHELINADVNQCGFNLNIDDFLAQYYRAITAKLYDYRAEQEWRLVLKKEHQGEYEFPYAKRIFIGKDMPIDRTRRVREVAAELEIPVFVQTINKNQDGFEYTCAY